MLTSEQAKNIIYVYSFLMETETNGWDRLDNHLEMLEWLDDLQLYREAEVLYSYHRNKTMGCGKTHKPGVGCTVKFIMEAVDSIIQLYEETDNLHPKNKYILSYYIALCKEGHICEMEERH